MNGTDLIDELLQRAAERETERAGLAEILQAVHANKREPARAQKAPLALPRRRMAAIAAAVMLFVLLVAAPAFARTIVVNGKTYFAFADEVRINGVTHSLKAGEENGVLLRLEDTNQYVAIQDLGAPAAPQVFAYAPGGSPSSPKNPDALSGKEGEPVSLEPVTVFPVIGDLAVREGPDTAYAAVGELYSGQCVAKVGVCGQWAIIEWEGAIAYAFNAYLFELPEHPLDNDPLALYATEPVNVRALPSSKQDSAVLHELQTGEEVACTGSIGDWSQIEWNGAKAYVFSKYLCEKRSSR